MKSCQRRIGTSSGADDGAGGIVKEVAKAPEECMDRTAQVFIINGWYVSSGSGELGPAYCEVSRSFGGSMVALHKK